MPTSRGSTSEAANGWGLMRAQTGILPGCESQISMIDRLDNVVKPNLTEEAYKHWTAVARFFRGYEYISISECIWRRSLFRQSNSEYRSAILFKDRDNRGVVMDKVYDDFKFVLANIRENDGTQC